MNEEYNGQINNEGGDGFLKTTGLFLFEVIKIALVASVIVFVIRYFLIQPFFVKGASMEPNFSDGEYLIVDELSYKFREPQRGEVIVFKYPRDPKQYYIKRIVGLPGEEIEIKGNQVIIHEPGNTLQDMILEEEYLPENELTLSNLGLSGRVWKLKADEYFVLGDNRIASSDSRTWGSLPKKFVIGKVFVRAFPLDKFTIFRSAQEN